MVMSSSLENVFSLIIVSNELSVWKGDRIFEVLNWVIKQTKKRCFVHFFKQCSVSLPTVD